LDQIEQHAVADIQNSFGMTAAYRLALRDGSRLLITAARNTSNNPVR